MLADELARPGAARSARHRPGSRPAARPRAPTPSSGCCRSARGRSSTPRPAPRGSRRTGRHSGTRLGRSASNICPDRLLAQLGMTVRAGIGDALVQQPGVQLVVALHPQPRREEPLAHQADLVLDLALLPARRRRAGHRIDQVVAAHLQEAAIVGPLAADEDRVHRGLHVVVDAARAGALEEGERPVVRVEHHLLRLARIGPHEQHPAVAQPHVRHLHRHRRAVDQHDLVAPVELVGLARREAQRHIRVRRRRRPLALPAPRIAPHRVVAALVAQAAQRPRTPGSASAARGSASPRSPPAADRARSRHGPSRGSGCSLALVAELRRLRPQHLAHDLPRHPQLAADRLDRLALDEIRPPDLRDRLHNQHPKPGPRSSREPP